MKSQYTALMAGAAGTLALLTALEIQARPVSYPGGWTIMQMNDGMMSALHYHYSPTFQDSFGVYLEQNWDDDFTFAGGQYNRLVKRWNGPKSQANTYLKVGAGLADPFGDGDTEAAGFIGFAADWETRRWFTSYEARAWSVGENQTLHHSARVGVAPYIGDYGDLHTWLMLQVGHHPDALSDLITTTPLVRFFYDVQLFEIGYTVETEEFLANWIVRF